MKDTYGVDFHSIKDIACGSNHSMALSEENRIYSWGNGEGGRLGHGTERSEAIPKEINLDHDAHPRCIFAGDVHSAFVCIKNQLYTWGKGTYGRLGLGFTNDALRPELVEEISHISVEDVSLGAYHTFAICNDNNVYAWGGLNYGKLGFRGKNNGNKLLPTPVPTLYNKNIIEISAGPYHTLCINEKGRLFAWGNDRQGKLGIESKGSKDIPTEVDNRKYYTLRLRNYQDYLNEERNKEFMRENDIYDEETIKKDQLFKNYDETFKVKSSLDSTKSTKLIQSDVCEKNLFLLSNSGELYG